MFQFGDGMPISGKQNVVQTSTLVIGMECHVCVNKNSGTTLEMFLMLKAVEVWGFSENFTISVMRYNVEVIKLLMKEKIESDIEFKVASFPAARVKLLHFSLNNARRPHLSEMCDSLLWRKIYKYINQINKSIN